MRRGRPAASVVCFTSLLAEERLQSNDPELATPAIVFNQPGKFTDSQAKIMSQYSAAVPNDGQVRPEIKSFFERFYEISDSPEGHEQYADMFTNSGQLIMGPNAVSGRDGLCHTFRRFDHVR